MTCVTRSSNPGLFLLAFYAEGKLSCSLFWSLATGEGRKGHSSVSLLACLTDSNSLTYNFLKNNCICAPLCMSLYAASLCLLAKQAREREGEGERERDYVRDGEKLFKVSFRLATWC